MSKLLGRIRRRLLGIDVAETTFARRGFRKAVPAVQERLESVGRAFLEGYHAALEIDSPRTLAVRLESVMPEFRGFAYEGAAMSLALRDGIFGWRKNRFREFLESAGSDHTYMLHVGAGWVLGRLPFPIEPALSRLDHVLRWLAIDGYGFHEGYFHAQRSIENWRVPSRLRGYARRAFDQGLGRSLWFVEGADADRIAHRVASAATSRRADLWSGVGLACAYAGGMDADAIDRLSRSASAYQSHLAQGAAFAAKARHRAGNLVDHTELATQLLCGLSAADAARVTDDALHALPPDGDAPAFEVWRARIQSRLAREVVLS
jgi:enediyne biosynthesis protein E3